MAQEKRRGTKRGKGRSAPSPIESYVRGRACAQARFGINHLPTFFPADVPMAGGAMKSSSPFHRAGRGGHHSVGESRGCPAAMSRGMPSIPQARGTAHPLATRPHGVERPFSPGKLSWQVSRAWDQLLLHRLPKVTGENNQTFNYIIVEYIAEKHISLHTDYKIISLS